MVRYYIKTKNGIMDFPTRKAMVQFVLKWWRDLGPSPHFVSIDKNLRTDYGYFDNAYGDIYFYTGKEIKNKKRGTIMVPLDDGSIIDYYSKQNIDNINKGRDINKARRN